MVNALTIDVEDYFHVTAFEKYIRPDEWDHYPMRVVDNTIRILDMLDEVSVKATFFVLGWVAERRPLLIKEISSRGHEIACHGYNHQLVYSLDPEMFREDLRRAKYLLEDICGNKVKGYRAPSYSITENSLWALDILIEEGFLYDSSIFPVYHDIYGMPHAKRFPHEISRKSGVIKEFPLSTLQLEMFNRKIRVPIAGGGYLRLFPTWFLARAINRVNKHEDQPVVLYFHPWEIDPDQPRIKAGFKSRFRHYLNLHTTLEKVNSLLSTFNFVSLEKILAIY